MSRKYVVIEGNIGSGKSTLTRALADLHGVDPLLERFADNAFLPLFYQNPERYAFPLEMSFLAERFEQLKRELLQPDLFSSVVIADYMLMKCRIFSDINLGLPESALYREFFSIISEKLPMPDLVVYLHTSPEACKNRIVSRGRSYEQDISVDYLSKVEQGYLEFFKTSELQFPVLMIERDRYDFISNPKDLEQVNDLTQKSFSPGVHRITGE